MGATAALFLLLWLPAGGHAERSLPHWERWEAVRSIQRAELALLAGALGIAETEARRATDLAPGEPIAWAVLTQVLQRRRDWEAMGQAARRWTNLDPDDAEAALLAGRAALEAGRGERARSQYRRAGELAPKDARSPLGLALSAARLDGDYGEMKRQLQLAWSLDHSLDFSTLPLDEAWASEATEEAFFSALQEVLDSLPVPAAPSKDPHAGTGAGVSTD